MITWHMADNMPSDGCRYVPPTKPEEVKFFKRYGLWRAGHSTFAFRSGLAGGCEGWGKTKEMARLGYDNDVAQCNRNEFTPFHRWLGDELVMI